MNLSQLSTTYADSAFSDALRTFLETGEWQSVLALLKQWNRAQTTLLLQHHLRRAGTRLERDAIEDLASFIASGSIPPQLPKLWTAEELSSEIVGHYGRHATSFLPQDAAIQMVCALQRQIASGLSKQAILAVIGLEIERRVGSTVDINKSNHGESVEFHMTSCQECGGGAGGGGKVACSACLGRAHKMIQTLAASENSLQKLLGGTDVDSLALQFVINSPEKYGCSACANRPVRDCACAWSLKVPAKPREGEVAEGRYTVSGNSKFCVLHLTGE